MKKSIYVIIALTGILFLSAPAFSSVEPEGLTSTQAYKLVMGDTFNTFIVDVRTRAEYEFVGHPDLPNGAPNIPVKFYPDWRLNEDFVSKVKERFNENNRLVMICRSGGRAKAAAEILLGAGFNQVLYVTDSFEGKKDRNGHRTVDGWKVNRLPYTYDAIDRLLYK